MKAALVGEMVAVCDNSTISSKTNGSSSNCKTLEVVAVVFKYFYTVSVASVVCDILHQESASAQASHCALITLSLS